MERFLDNLSYVWKGIIPLSPQIESMDINPQFNQVIFQLPIALIISAQIKETQDYNPCFPVTPIGPCKI